MKLFAKSVKQDYQSIVKMAVVKTVEIKHTLSSMEPIVIYVLTIAEKRIYP